MGGDPQSVSPLPEANLKLAQFHKEHERFYSSSPLDAAVRLQRHARTLQALTDRWRDVVPSTHTARNPYEGAEDLNSEAAIALDGSLFMEGETNGSPTPSRAVGRSRPRPWRIDEVADVLGERHRIITNDWLAAHAR
jgi:hypothetical protein